MCVLLLGLGGLCTPAHEDDELVVVVSPDVPISDLGIAELRAILKFQKRYWAPGRPIRVVYGDHCLHAGSLLLQDLYEMDYPELRRLILEKLYQGELDLPPRVVATDDALMRYVAQGRGLLALVHREALTAESAGAVKVLTVEGKAFGTADYPLSRD